MTSFASGIALTSVAVGAFACLHGPTVCGDLVCPPGLVCVTDVDGNYAACGDPDSVTACEGHAEGEPCSFDQVASGSCRGGLCIQAICGNAFLDANEVCDEGSDNLDGVIGRCNEQCSSEQVCGNGTADLAVGEDCDPSIDLKHDGCDSCQSVPPLWRELELSQHLRNHAIAHHPVLGQTILFGGELIGLGSMSDRTLEWTGRLWRELPLSKRPSRRARHAMVYDAAREQVVLFGGEDEEGNSVGDTWLWDGGQWIRARPETSPPPLQGAALAFDSSRGVVWLFGGNRYGDGSGAIGLDNELWRWDGDNWEVVAVGVGNTTAGRYLHSLAYDSLSDRLIACGGRNDSNEALTSCVAWDFASWTDLVGDLPRADGTLVADPHDGTLFFISSNGAAHATRHIRQSMSWTEVSEGSEPVVGPLVAGQAAFIPAAAAFLAVAEGAESVETHVDSGGVWQKSAFDLRLIDSDHVVGSYAAMTGHSLVVVLAKLVDWDGSGWKYLDDPPGGGRQRAAMAPGVDGRSALYFGGASPEDPSTAFASTLLWDGSAWSSPAAGVEPAPRAAHAMALDRLRGQIVLFGGASTLINPDDSQLMGDTWIWSWPDSGWEERANLSPSPSPRLGAALAFDEITNRVVLFGGTGAGGEVLGDLWEWDGSQWSQSQVTGSLIPPPRTGALFVYDPNRRRSILHGGIDEDGVTLRDAWEWDGLDRTWKRTGVEIITPRLANQAGVYNAVNARLVVAGGVDSSEAPIAFFYGDPTGDDRCDLGVDVDGDGLSGCSDIDCWAYCTPFCSPGTTPTGEDPMDRWPYNCPTMFTWCSGGDECNVPHCGDGACNAELENHLNCALDCEPPVICGDFECGPGEDSGNCLGDCPP